MWERAHHVFSKRLMPRLAARGIERVTWQDLEKRDRKSMSELFGRALFPALTPLAVDPAHPFPYVSDLSFNLGVLVRHPKVDTVRFARIKVPPLLGRFVPLDDGEQGVSGLLGVTRPVMPAEDGEIAAGANGRSALSGIQERVGDM